MRLDPRSDPSTARAFWLGTGVAWAGTSALLLAQPTYWEPVTFLDYAAVVAYAAAWMLLAPSAILIGRLAGGGATRALSLAIAGAALVAGAANLAEDGLRLEVARDAYVAGVLLATALLVPFAYLFARARANRLAALLLVLFVGVGFTAAGVGGLIVLLVFGALALRSEWFLPEATPRTGAA